MALEPPAYTLARCFASLAMPLGRLHLAEAAATASSSAFLKAAYERANYQTRTCHIGVRAMKSHDHLHRATFSPMHITGNSDKHTNKVLLRLDHTTHSDTFSDHRHAYTNVTAQCKPEPTYIRHTINARIVFTFVFHKTGASRWASASISKDRSFTFQDRSF